MNSSQDETETLRRIIAFLIVEYAEKNTVDLWDDDINAMTGTLTVETSPDRADTTRITYAPNRPGVAPAKRERKPINHREQAERHASQAAHLKSDRQHHPIDPVASDFHLRMAMVHATLANGDTNAADQANARDALTLLRRREHAIREAVSAHIAHALASRDTGRWKAATDLAKALDEGDANMDDLVDRHLIDDGWDARSAWKTPASAIRSDDPWAAAAPVTADDIPEPVRRVVTEQVVRALLDPNEERGSQWARRLAWALRDVGVDLTSAIQARITDMTLGADPSEPPF